MIDDVTLKIMTQHLGFVNCVLSNYFQTDRVCNIHGAMNVAYTAYLAASKTEQILYPDLFRDLASSAKMFQVRYVSGRVCWPAMRRGWDWDGRAASAAREATIRHKVGSRGGIVAAATLGNPGSRSAAETGVAVPSPARGSAPLARRRPRLAERADLVWPIGAPSSAHTSFGRTFG
jgi:hypothetical protein